MGPGLRTHWEQENMDKLKQAPNRAMCQGCQLAFFKASFNKFEIFENDLALKILSFIYCFAFFHKKLFNVWH